MRKLFYSYFQAKWSPLHTLVLSMQMSCVDKLLENGVDIDLPDKVGLFISGIQVCQFMHSIFAWTKIAFLIKQEGLTALHKAIIGKKEAVISHLLRRGASPHVMDKVRKHSVHNCHKLLTIF